MTHHRIWEGMSAIVMFDEAKEIICRAACEQAGVPLPENEVKQRTRECSEMIDAFGRTGSRCKRGKKAGERSEKGIQQIIKGIRSGKLTPPAYVIAIPTERNGRKPDVCTGRTPILPIRPIHRCCRA